MADLVERRDRSVADLKERTGRTEIDLVMLDGVEHFHELCAQDPPKLPRGTRRALLGAGSLALLCPSPLWGVMKLIEVLL